MEIRFDQLLLVVMVVLFTLADVVFRRLRKRHGGAPSSGEGDEGVARDEEIFYDEDAVADEEIVQREEIRAPRPPPVLPPPAASRAPAPRERVASPVSPLPARRPPPAAIALEVSRRRRRGGAPAFNARDARRAIVIMAVFGPCRGLESDESR